MKLRLIFDRARVKNHFTYHFWKYIVLAALSVFVWDMVFTQTEYRPPRDRQISVYIQSSLAYSEVVEAFIQELWHESVPDMERVNAVLLSTSSLTDMYAVVQLTAYLAAGEGDIYMLTRDDFKAFAARGAFLPLETFVQDGQLGTQGIGLSAGYVTPEAGLDASGDGASGNPPRLYGIPTDTLTGFQSLIGVDSKNMVLSIAAAHGDRKSVLIFLDALIGKTRDGVSDSNLAPVTP